MNKSEEFQLELTSDHPLAENSSFFLTNSNMHLKTWPVKIYSIFKTASSLDVTCTNFNHSDLMKVQVYYQRKQTKADWFVSKVIYRQN